MKIRVCLTAQRCVDERTLDVVKYEDRPVVVCLSYNTCQYLLLLYVSGHFSM